MRVLHVCLSCFYIDNAGYQENFLVRQHVQDGHNVRVIASTETFDGRGGLKYLDPSTYRGGDGAEVIRLPYVRWLPHKIAKKLRIHPDVYRHIAEFKPNTILFHGCAGNEIVTVAQYVRDNPDTIYYVDSHEDYNNSARNIVSRNILHGLFYKSRFQRALPWIRKILCVSTESMGFVADLYGAPKDRIEFYPLGGFVLRSAEIGSRRARTRSELGLTEETFVFLQSGKMTARKKLAESIRAFSAMPGSRLRFLVVGVLTEPVRAEIEALIAADPRVSFLGWKSPEQLTDLLCAADAYVQPGTQSATMQHALCCGCPVIIDDVPAHQVYERSGAILVNSSAPLMSFLNMAIKQNRTELRRAALDFAKSTLDYRILADRILR